MAPQGRHRVGDDVVGSPARRRCRAVLGVQTGVQGRTLPRLHADHDLRGRRGVGLRLKDNVDDGKFDVVLALVRVCILGLPSSAARSAQVIAGDPCNEANEAAVPLVDGLKEEREGSEEKQLRVNAPERLQSPRLLTKSAPT